MLRGPYSGRLNGFGGEPFVQNNARYGGQYVEPDSVRDVGESGNYGGYGFYGNGNGQNQNSAPDSWSDVPKETYKYNGTGADHQFRLFQGRPLQIEPAERM